jgi:hypothetical protein
MLCVADRASSYFTIGAAEAAAAILSACEANGYRQLLFLGSSKGGFGALLAAGLAAKMAPKRAVHALAFGPPTRLWPENPMLHDIPSYRQMMQRRTLEPALAAALDSFGDLGFVATLPNIHATIAYAEGCEMDVVEQARLVSPAIRKIPVPYPYHGAITPFNLTGRNVGAVRRHLEATLRGRVKDADQADITPAAIADLSRWVIANRWLPTLPELVDQVLAVEPSFQDSR